MKLETVKNKASNVHGSADFGEYKKRIKIEEAGQ
jgi:hypothetical protein